MTAAHSWPRSRVLSWISFGVAVLALALVLRYLVIEPHPIGITCSQDVVPWWCRPREAIVFMHARWLWGAFGLLGGMLAFVFGWRWALRLGFAMSIMGLILYNADWAAPGLVLTLLRLPRS